MESSRRAGEHKKNDARWFSLAEKIDSARRVLHDSRSESWDCAEAEEGVDNGILVRKRCFSCGGGGGGGVEEDEEVEFVAAVESEVRIDQRQRFKDSRLQRQNEVKACRERQHQHPHQLLVLA